jgi:ribonuclease BN (tRNA processing enzyme)
VTYSARMSLVLQVLGKSPAWPDAGEACSGYLVVSPATTLLLDCGSGVVSQLRRAIEPRALDAVFITHLHADHCFDLVPLAYLLKFCPPPTGQPERAIPLWLPSGGRAAWSTVSAMWNAPDLMSEVFDIYEYQPDDQLMIGDLDLRLAAVPHYLPTVAVDIRTGDHRLTFGADCGPNDALPVLAYETPLLIAEATMPEDQPWESGHLSARQAGEIAHKAGAQRLLLTHFAAMLDEDVLARSAKTAFSGMIAAAASQMRLIL